MIVRGVIKDGGIKLHSPIPAEWEGRNVRIRAVRPKPTAEEIVAWGVEMERNAALINPEDADELKRILDELHAEEKAGLRLAMEASRAGQAAS